MTLATDRDFSAGNKLVIIFKECWLFRLSRFSHRLISVDLRLFWDYDAFINMCRQSTSLNVLKAFRRNAGVKVLHQLFQTLFDFGCVQDFGRFVAGAEQYKKF